MGNIIKFVNLNNGNVFIGDKPYIHWFEGPLSTDLIYIHKLCILSNFEMLTISTDDTQVFSLLNHYILEDSKTEIINNSEYINIDELKAADIVSQGYQYKDNLYLHILYFSASSNTGGEHLCNFYIDTDDPDDEQHSYTLGADFYVANENLYINAANFGVEFPDAIQKAIYDVDIKEEKRDNITLNRKLKELLSNYWDVIACKGSYKSLINSLKWFEWSDLLELKEIWKKEDFGNILYESRTLNSILEDKYKEYLTNTAKTTYLSLQYALQSIVKDKYDSEKNPKLQQVSNKWSIEELFLKMCLLGNFYKTYFMPIHLDLLHSTITDTVFTNTIKTLQTPSSIGREDYIIDCEDFDITINDNKPVFISNVSVGADSNTLFVSKPEDYNNYNTDIISCVPLKDIDEINENGLKILYTHNYNGPGAIVKISCDIPLKDDVIKKEYLTITRPEKDTITLIDNKLYKSNNITFYILVTNIGDIEGVLRFETASGRSFNKKFNIKVHDISNIRLELYRLDYKPKLSENETYDDRLNDKRYMFERINRTPNDKNFYNYDQYIFTRGGDVQFNNVIVTKVFNPKNNNDNEKIKSLEKTIKYYDDPNKNTNWEKYIIFDGEKQRNIYIYKTTTTSPVNIKSDMIYNNDLYFLPEKYVLTSVYDKNNTINTGVYSSSIICVKPVIDDGVNIIPFNYGQDIEYVVWTYKNISTGENFEYKQNTISPLIKTPNTSLTKGYYDIIFRYKLVYSADIHEVSLKSAFRK